MKDFDVLQKLGSGSFGTVFKVKRKVDNIDYVVKSVRIADLSYQEQVDAINEVRLLAQMDCPYIVKYFDSFIDDENLNIVMEYCNRGDLQSLLKKAKDKNTCKDAGSVTYGLRENVTWNITLQVICGLYYLHKKKVLHRDLKTANVFLMREESLSKSSYFGVKIGDLGVAKLLETSTAFAQTIVGTPYYLSPELCSDKPYRDKSDCWALGVLIYECCTLAHPFEARNQYALIMKILQSPVVPPSPHTTSPELSRLILWLLQKDPSKRPTMREILCEVCVRRQMLSHNIELPDDDLEGDTWTNYLGVTLDPSNNPTRTITPTSEKSQNSRNMGTMSAAELNPSSVSSVRSAGVPPRPGPLPMKKSSQVRGDRVRGPINQPRIVSDKARSRYQVKAAESKPSRTVYHVDDEPKESYHLEGPYRANDSDSKYTSQLEDDNAKTMYSNSSKDVVDIQDKTNTSIQVNYDDEEEVYDEDFEEFDEEGYDDNEVNHGGGSTPVQDMIAADGAIVLDPALAPSIFEASIKRPVDGSKDSVLFDDNDVNSTIDTNQEIDALKSLIREAREKSYSSLGDKLFDRLYDLCQSHMTVSNSKSDEDAMTREQENSEFVRNLEGALCDQLHGGIDVACEAVFNMKVLLALEHRLDALT